MTEPTGRVCWHVTMSLDGFIAAEDNDMSWLALDWLPAGTEAPQSALRMIETTGAVLAGRGWYEAALGLGGRRGIYGGKWDGPVFVLTHRPEPDDADVTFRSGDIRSAVAGALAAADGRNVVLFGGDVVRQALDAGLVDEVLVHVAPVLLGAGVRLTGAGTGLVRLAPVELGRTGPLADLHYRVVKEQ